MYLRTFDLLDSLVPLYNSWIPFGTTWTSEVCSRSGTYPLIDTSETDDKFVIEVFGAVIDPKDVSIELNRSTITISGKFPDRRGLKIQWREAPASGSFYREFSAPEVDLDSLQVSEDRGVIKLELKKKNGKRKIMLDKC